MVYLKQYVTSKDHITLRYYYDQMSSRGWTFWWDLITQFFWAPTMCQKFGWEIYTCKSFINTLKYQFHRFHGCSFIYTWNLQHKGKTSAVTLICRMCKSSIISSGVSFERGCEWNPASPCTASISIRSSRMHHTKLLTSVKLASDH